MEDVSDGSTVKRKRALLICDVVEWAFHINNTDMACHVKDEWDCDHYSVTDYQYSQGTIVPPWEEYDAVFAPYHKWGLDALYPWNHMLGSLRAQWFDPANPVPMGPHEFALIKQFRGFQACNKRMFEEMAPHCDNAVYLTNPVNTKRFPNPVENYDDVICSWNGNASHSSAGIGVDVKGFHTIVRPAIQKTEAPFEFCEFSSKRLRPNVMYIFYKKANVSLCASLYEGASNSTMEAMAMGQVLISTDVGNVREMQDSQQKHFGDTGIVIVDRSSDAFAAAIIELRKDLPRLKAMGQLNREEIFARWSWDHWAQGYRDFLNMAVNK